MIHPYAQGCVLSCTYSNVIVHDRSHTALGVWRCFLIIFDYSYYYFGFDTRYHLHDACINIIRNASQITMFATRSTQGKGEGGAGDGGVGDGGGAGDGFNSREGCW